jgi:hypothetical protein
MDQIEKQSIFQSPAPPPPRMGKAPLAPERSTQSPPHPLLTARHQIWPRIGPGGGKSVILIDLPVDSHQFLISQHGLSGHVAPRLRFPLTGHRRRKSIPVTVFSVHRSGLSVRNTDLPVDPQGNKVFHIFDSQPVEARV